MKIRSKITLVFTLLTNSLLLGIFIFIYYFSNRYTENEFYHRLEERVTIAAQTYFQEDELSANIFSEIRKKHLQILPDEHEVIYRVELAGRELVSGFKKELPDYFFNQIINKRTARLKTDEVYHVGTLYEDNEGDFFVIVSARDLYGRAKIRNLRNTLIIAFLVGTIAIFIVGRYYAGNVLRPIQVITEKANKISVSNLHLRLDTGNKKDELAKLAITFNNMLDRLETSFDIQNNFVNNASHELRNPLTAIMGETEITLKKERPPEEYKDSLRIIEKEAQRLDLLVNSLLKLAQTGSETQGLAFDPIRVDELLMDVKRNIDTTRPKNVIVFDFAGLPLQSELLIIPGNRSLLTVAFNNIIDNACKFSEDKEVVIKISTSKDSVSVSIRDQGVGIPEGDLKNITEPFYRAANARSFKGFGVGLPLTQKIINLHRGIMTISSEMMLGTEVTISFPLAGNGKIPYY